MNTNQEFDSPPAANALWDVYMNREQVLSQRKREHRKSEYWDAANKFLAEIEELDDDRPDTKARKDTV